MSERELRSLFNRMQDDYVLGGYYKLVDAALAEPPDVVAVLRLFKEYHDSPLSDERDRQIISMLAHGLRRKFSVQETPDGYEWTEEATDETPTA